MGPMLVRRMKDRNLSCGFGGQGSIEELSRSYFGGGVGLRPDRRGLGREGPWGGQNQDFIFFHEGERDKNINIFHR